MMIVSHEIVTSTLNSLQSAGNDGKEGIVLWLGRRTGADAGVIQQAYVPIHAADADRFWISLEGMRAMMAKLRDEGMALLAQVHSHPRHAFHSEADDHWALVRYVGALSIVLPWFARRSTIASFFSDGAFFQLDANNRWIEVTEKKAVLEIRS
jgi:hypothetical protein